MTDNLLQYLVEVSIIFKRNHIDEVCLCLIAYCDEGHSFPFEW